MNATQSVLHFDPSAPEVTQFIIAVPTRLRVSDICDRIEAYMTARYPAFAFDARLDGPTVWDDYALIPIVGVAGDMADTIRMLNPPADALMVEMRAYLARFDPVRSLN